MSGFNTNATPWKVPPHPTLSPLGEEKGEGLERTNAATRADKRCTTRGIAPAGKYMSKRCMENPFFFFIDPSGYAFAFGPPMSDAAVYFTLRTAGGAHLPTSASSLGA